MNKYCPTCKNTLPHEDFYYSPSRANRAAGPYSSECKECSRVGAKARASLREPIESTAEQRRLWRAEKKRNFLHNRDKLKARTSLNRAKRLKRAPKWANLKKIERIYMLAQWASRFTNEPLEVDHIIPLQGEMVSGLHVEDNLQIIPRSENRRKKNKWESESWTNLNTQNI